MLSPNMDAFLLPYVARHTVARVAATDTAVVFLNFNRQQPVSWLLEPNRSIKVAGVQLPDGTRYGRHLLYDVPQGVVWRQPPLLSQLTTLQNWRVPVNPYRHFVCPTIADLALFMCEDEAAESVDVFDTHGAYGVHFNCPLRLVAACITRVAWTVPPPCATSAVTLPVAYRNTVDVVEDGSGSEYTLHNVPHGVMYSNGIGSGVRVTALVCDGAVPEATLVEVCSKGVPQLPLQYRWEVILGVQTLCLPLVMERATEIWTCAARLGMPACVTLDVVYRLVRTNRVRTLRDLLTYKLPRKRKPARAHRTLSKWASGVRVSLLDLMHCSCAFEPKQRLALGLLINDAVTLFGRGDNATATAEAGSEAEAEAVAAMVEHGCNTSLQKQWVCFTNFLTRHHLWGVCEQFTVIPLPPRPSRRKEKRHQCVGWSIGAPAPFSHFAALEKPMPSPPLELDVDTI